MEEYNFKKYILFDLDGTLTDPKVGICTSIQYALAHFGITIADIDQLEPCIGPPLLDSFQQFFDFPEEKAREAAAKYRERYGEIGWKENKVYPGIKHMLKVLKAKGFHMAVASSKPQVYVEKIMNHFGLAKYFDVLVGSNLDGTRTDKKELIDEAFRQLFKGEKIRKDLVYMVGDRKFDVIGARKQGVESIAVAYGYGDIDELIDEHADYVVSSVKELEDFLLRQTAEDLEGRIDRPKKAVKVPIPFKAILFLLLSLAGFIFTRFFAELGLTWIAANTVRFMPKAIADFLLYSKELNINTIGFNGNMGAIITGLSYVAGALVILPYALKLIRRTKRDTLLLRLFNVTPWEIILGVLMTVSLVIFAQNIAILTSASANSEVYQEVARSQYSCGLVVGAIVYGLISPVCEEVLFRGIIFTTFRRYINVYAAMAVCAVIFGIYHGTLVQGVYALVMGFVMAYMYEYYGNFLAAVIVHALANLMAYFLTNFMPVFAVFICWPLTIIMLLVSVACFVVLLLIKKGIIGRN